MRLWFCETPSHHLGGGGGGGGGKGSCLVGWAFHGALYILSISLTFVLLLPTLYLVSSDDV